MKKLLDIRSLVLGVFFGAVVMFGVAASSGKHTTWEYTAYYFTGSHPDDATIAKLGNEGWEMVGYFAVPEARSVGFMFKRER